MEEKNINEEPGYYAVIPANVRYSDITANAKLLYGEITALSNKTGVCFASNYYFSELYKVSKVSISKWINELVEKGFIESEIIRNEKKQIIHRYLKISSIPIKENFNTPIKEKFKDNNTSINNINNNKYIDQFKKFYDKYPKKVSRKAAEKSFMKAIKEVSFEDIMNGLDNYIKEIEITKKDKQYIKQPSTWLNQGCWDDDYRLWSDFSLLKSNDVPKGYGMKEGVLHKLHHYKGSDLFVHNGIVYFSDGNEVGDFPKEKIEALEKGLLDE